MRPSPPIHQFPDSPRVWCITEEYTWQDFRAELMQSRQVFSRNRLIFFHRSKRNIWAIKWYSELPSHKVSFPSDKRSWTFRNHYVAKSCTTTQHMDDCFARTLWSAVVKSPRMFRFGHDCTSTSSAKSPCYFRLQADFAVWVFREVTVNTVLAQARFHFCSRLHW